MVPIVPMAVAHAAAVLRIYQAGIDTGDATIETTAPSREDFDADHLNQHRFVAVDTGNRIVGWVAAPHPSPVEWTRSPPQSWTRRTTAPTAPGEVRGLTAPPNVRRVQPIGFAVPRRRR